MSKRLLKTMVALLAIAAAAAGPVRGQNSNVSWVLTPYGDLQNGDTVVIVDKTLAKAMANNNGIDDAPSAVGIGLNSAKDSLTGTPAATLQWVVVLDGGIYKFRVPGTSNYLYCENTNNGVRVGDDNNNQFTFVDNQGYYDVPFLKNTNYNRYIGVYNENEWRCYTSTSINIKNTVISFYKKTTSSGGGSTPEPEPEPVPVPITVRLAAGTEEAGNWTLASGGVSVQGTQVLGNVMSGSQVTATYGGDRKVKSVKAVKYVAPAATVATAPTAAAAIIEVGSTAALVGAGTANGGTMMYAVTTTNTKPTSTDGFSATVPTAEGRSAGTYYVWYYAKADAEHSDSEIAGPVSVTLQAATITVTWNDNDITGEWGTTFTKDGVTITADMIDFHDKNFMGGGTFSTTLGNFTKIEVSSGYCGASGTGWSGNSTKMTWTGNASSVSFSGDFMGMGQGTTNLVFTIEPTN